MGLWPQYEAMKREVAALSGEHVQVWDFSGYDERTSERVPPQDSTDKMRWYYETSHFRPELGHLMIGTMYRPDADAERIGVQLSPSKIDRHLAEIRASAETYRRTRPADMEWLREIYRETAPWRAHHAQKYRALELPR